jgi:hypothetical protein
MKGLELGFSGRATAQKASDNEFKFQNHQLSNNKIKIKYKKWMNDGTEQNGRIGPSSGHLPEKTSILITIQGNFLHMSFENEVTYHSTVRGAQTTWTPYSEVLKEGEKHASLLHFISFCLCTKPFSLQ